MQPSTWNDTNQHWIPQFLLKGFGTKGKSSNIYELNKESQKVAVRDVSKVASRAHLLTDQDDELVRDIESRAAPVINSIRKRSLSRISVMERQLIDKLVCTMMLNDPNSGLNIESARKDIIDKFTTDLNKALNKAGGVLDEPVIREHFDETLPHNKLWGFMESKRNQVIDVLRFMGMRAYRPTDGEHFIIGDSPVLVVRNTVNGQTSLLNSGSQIILPIGSSCMLVYSWATEMNVITDGGILGKEQVRSLNSDYYHGTNSRYIYGRDEEVLKRSRLLSLERQPGQRSNEVETGWFMMQRENQIRQRMLDEQDAADARMLEMTARELVALAIAQSENATVSDQDSQWSSF